MDKTPKRKSFANTEAVATLSAKKSSPFQTPKGDANTAGAISAKRSGKRQNKRNSQGNQTPKLNGGVNTPSSVKKQSPKVSETLNIVQNLSIAAPASANKQKNKRQMPIDEESPSPKKAKFAMFAGTASLNDSNPESNKSSPKKGNKKQKGKNKTANDVIQSDKLKLRARKSKNNLKEVKAMLGKGELPTEEAIKYYTATVAELSKKPTLTKSGTRKLRQFKRICKNINMLKNPSEANSVIAIAPARQNKKQAKLEKKKGQGAVVPAVQKPVANKNKPLVANKNKPLVALPKIDAESGSSESDYEVETNVTVDKLLKGLNEFKDSDDESEEGDSFLDDEAEEEEDSDAEEEESELVEGEADSDDEGSDEIGEEGENAKAKPQKQTNGKKPTNENAVKPKGPIRYVLFVGNLPFDVTQEEIAKHFEKVGEIKDVRIPTERGTNKPRGFAYVEVANSEQYERALTLHHSQIKNRRINVMYTVGGNKKSETAKKVIKSKNMSLKAARDRGLLAGSKPKKQHQKKFKKSL